MREDPDTLPRRCPFVQVGVGGAELPFAVPGSADHAMAVGCSGHAYGRDPDPDPLVLLDQQERAQPPRRTWARGKR
jgi:hypothetical protein